MSAAHASSRHTARRSVSLVAVVGLLASLVGGFLTPATAAPVVASDTLQSGAGFGFGRNDFGQVKPGTTANQLGAVQLPAPGSTVLKDAVSIAAGNGFSVWVDHYGKVWSIGDNSNGQSGSGSSATTLTVPTAAVGFGGSSPQKAVKVVSFGNSVQVLDDGGKVWQWGQVANSNTTLTVQKTPNQITFPTGAQRIVDIAAGNQFALAIDAAGKPYSWGRNDRGQLGTNSNNTVTNPAAALYKPPVLLTGQTATIEAGKDFGLYVVSGPSGVDVYSWGAGTSWQLGNNSNKADVKIPTKAFSLSTPSLKAVSVSSGSTHSLLLTSDGKVRTWGMNGLNTYGTPTEITSPLFMPTTTPPRIATTVAAGDGSSFVTNSDGTVAAWGTDTTGQLGRTTTGTVLQPTLVTIPGTTPAMTTGPPVQIVSRNGSTYALVDAEIASTPDRAGFNFGSFPTSPLSSQVAPAHAFSLTNVATKPLNVTSFGVEGANATDFVASGSQCQNPLPVDSSCSITLTFRPVGTGQRTATLALRTSNTRGGSTLSYLVPLVGAGYTAVQGLANYKLDLKSGTATSFTGRGNRLPVANIDPSLIPEVVPDVGASTIPRLSLPTIPRITIPRLTIPRLTVGEIAPQASTIPRLTIPRLTLAQIGLPTIGQLSLPTIPRITIPRLTIPRLPLLAEGGWEEFVKDYPGLQNLPVNTITFEQLFAQPANANVAAPADRITLDRLDLANSVLAQASFFALLMGTTKLSQYPVDWCSELAPFESPAQCSGAGLGRSLLDLSITEGIPIDALQASAVPLGQITPDGSGSDKWANSVWPLLALDAIAGNIAGTHLNVPLSTIPNLASIVDCSHVDCVNLAGRRLGDQDVAGWVRSTARIGDLGSALNGLKAAWIVEPFLDRSEFPWEQLPRTAIPLQAYPNKVPLQVDVDLNCLQAADTHFTFDLPSGYDYVPDTATLTKTRGAGTVELASTVSGQHVDVVVPDSVFAANGPIDCTNDSGHLRVGITVLPPDTASSNQKATGAVKTGGLTASGTQATGVSTTGQYDPPSLSPDGGTFQPDELVLGHLEPGQVQYLNIDVPPNMTLETSVSQMGPESDLDMVLLHPAGAALDPVLSGNANPVSVPFGESATVDSTAIHTNTHTAGGALQDVPLLPGRLVAAVSALRDNVDESVSVLTRAGTNNRYTVQVSGFNRSGGDYTVRARTSSPQNLGPCTITPPTVSYPSNVQAFYGGPTGPTPTGFAATDDTVVLVNPSRLEAYYPGKAQAVLDSAYAYAHSAGVKGQVVRLDSSADVNQAYQAWDQSPCDPNLSNEVVKQINTFVFGLINASPAAKIRYETIAGGHAIVPHAMLLDTIRDANEREEAGDLAITGNNPISNAFALSRFPSDTPYGTINPLIISGQVVYVPTIAVGRLGETADAIKQQLDTYVSLGGVADPPDASKSATVTDYDFLSRGGDRVVDALDADYTVNHDLTSPTQWTRADLINRWLGRTPAPPSIGVLNMHYDQYRALPALGNATGNLSDLFTADDVASGPPLTQRIVLTVGCHSALDVPDKWLKSTADATQLLRSKDWAQRYGEKGLAVMIGNLGYGYADTNVVAYSALEQQLVAEAMAKHYDLGTSLVVAQQGYMSHAPSLSPYDLKSLQQMVLWGVPQYRTTQAPAAVPPAPPTGTLTTDPATGLSSYSLTVTPETRTINDGSSTHMEARLGTGPWQSFGQSGAPILPVVSVPLIAQQGRSVRSVLPIEMTTSGDTSTTVTFARAGSDTGLQQEPTLSGDWPSTQSHTVTQPLPNLGLEASTLVYTPAQIHLDGTAPGHANVLSSSSASFLATYGAPGHAVTPDTFTSISASHTPASGTSSALTSWAVDVQPAANAQTTKVWVLARPQSASGAWVHVDLSSVNGTHWTATKNGFLGEYIVLGLNSLGYGAASTLKGGLWDPGDLSALHVNGTENNGWYNSITTVTTDSGTIYDNGTPVGSSVTLSNGEHQLSLLQSNGKFVSSNGQISYLFLRVDAVVPTAVITLGNALPTFPSDNGQPHPIAGSSQPYSISVTYGPSGAGGPITVNGTPISGTTGFLDTSKVGQRSLVVSATSTAGLTGTATKDFRVVYKSATFVAPVQSTNTVLPGFGYQYTFRMFDNANNQVTTAPAGTTFANTFTSAATCAPPGSINLPTGGASASPTYDAANQRWQWNLSKSGINCQQLTFTLNDGWTRIATNVTTLSSS